MDNLLCFRKFFLVPTCSFSSSPLSRQPFLYSLSFCCFPNPFLLLLFIFLSYLLEIYYLIKRKKKQKNFKNLKPISSISSRVSKHTNKYSTNNRDFLVFFFVSCSCIQSSPPKKFFIRVVFERIMSHSY